MNTAALETVSYRADIHLNDSAKIQLLEQLFEDFENNLAAAGFDNFEVSHKHSGAKETENMFLWKRLLEHAGNDVRISIYGPEGKDPENIALEDWDTNEIILDAGIYTLKPREDI